MKEFVKSHGAVHNDFLTRFSNGDVNEEERRRFAIEFFHFSREWPAILATLLVNTPDEQEAAALATILVSELGDMHPCKKRHELLFRKFLGSIGIDPKEAMRREMLPATRAFIDGMKRLFSTADHTVALGAEFALETMAIPMWDLLIAGLKHWKQRAPVTDIVFFTFHRALEQEHEDAVDGILGMQHHDPAVQERFRNGAEELLILLEEFWHGMEDNHAP